MPLCPETGIAYDRSGPRGGTPVLLLHAGVADRRMWDPQWNTLTADRDVVRLDLRGFGESTECPVSTWRHDQDVANTLQALGIEQAHLIGCSFGAGVATEVALEHPEHVASLLLVTPGGALLTEMSLELRGFFDAEAAALDGNDLDAAVQANLDWWVDGPRRGADPERQGLREQVEIMQRRAFELTAGWDRDADELDPPAPDRLAELTVPTLVLSGALDIPSVTLAADMVATHVRDARHTSWPDVAHLPSLERPADFESLVRDWLNRVETA